MTDNSRGSEYRPMVRPDLRWTAYGGGRWVGHDPIGGAFYYFSDLEFAVIKLCDGSRTLADVAAAMAADLRSAGRPSDWLARLIGQLRQTRLLQGEASLSADRVPASSRNLRRWVFNPLAIRIPVWRPRRHSALTRAAAAIVMNRWAVGLLVCIGAVAAAGLLMTLILDRQAMEVDMARLGGTRWYAWVGCFIAVKSIHEYGHYMATAKWRTACSELGVLLLFFTPCFYCDTTDSWRLRSPLRRASIAAAGIYMELWIAALAAVAYLSTDDTWIHTLAAAVVLMCAVGTVLINANPCFRYDGYYILTDLWGVPNLAAQANAAAWQIWMRLLGSDRPAAVELDRPVWHLATFAVVSWIYRIVVVGGLIYILWSFLVPQGLGLAAIAMTALLAHGWLRGIGRFFRRTFFALFDRQPVRLWRLVIVASCCLALIYAAAMIPVRQRVIARGYVEHSQRLPLFIDETATLIEVDAVEGESAQDRLSAGEVLCRFDSVDLRQRLLELQHEIAQLQRKIEVLGRLRASDSAADQELPTAREMLAERQRQLLLTDEQLQRLTIKTPAAGHWQPNYLPAVQTLGQEQGFERLSSSLSRERVGSQLPRGTLLGWVTQGDGMVFNAAVPERDVKRLRNGQGAAVVFDRQAGRRTQATVVAISPQPLATCPPELQFDQSLVSLRDERGRLVFEEPHYLVKLSLAQPEGWPAGSRGFAVLETSSRPVALWLIDQLPTSLRRYLPVLGENP